MQATAVSAIREQFADGRSAAPGDVPAMVTAAHEAAEFLETGVVQNALNDKGNYELGKGGIEVQ